MILTWFLHGVGMNFAWVWHDLWMIMGLDFFHLPYRSQKEKLICLDVTGNSGRHRGAALGLQPCEFNVDRSDQQWELTSEGFLWEVEVAQPSRNIQKYPKTIDKQINFAPQVIDWNRMKGVGHIESNGAGWSASNWVKRRRTRQEQNAVLHRFLYFFNSLWDGFRYKNIGVPD